MSGDFLAKLPTTPTLTASTVPANGDLNPYGVAVVPRGVLVSNFNNSQNLQGTGTTLVKVLRNGSTSTFFQAGSGVGLTTALGVMRKGFAFVGSVPTIDGTSATVGQGEILIVNRFGQLVGTMKNSKLLDGPWDLTVNDQGNTAQIFVSNVLSGTITRIDVKIAEGHVSPTSAVQIASGYTATTDPAALVIGPTGLAYDARTGVLYVASTGDNAIYAIADAGNRRTDAGTGTLVTSDSTYLHGPLGLAFAPNGDLLVSNGDAVNFDANNPSTIVEFTRKGQFVDQISLSSSPGAAFGIAVGGYSGTVVLLAVNDADNTVEAFRVPKK
ncbi:MAG TPA: hypothetical protein VG406_20580 [Isosphaeraceae bacterium]|nr:hypothetical protein [Isosphaeraceae bacterium]